MDNQKQAVAQAVKDANNVLITVSSSPSVDQLAACIGLTLTLNKMGKHATAVFSGDVPSTIEFLQPEKTIEKNTDSLRDFIIALDKSKADKLRYKLEDRVVKIFITPYKTSISEKDLEFSQGDFNVDVVVALGVHQQSDLDQAITAHGRILHDAKVITVNIQPGGELGMINWLDASASSLSELVTQLIDALDKKMIDGQIATALLTGIVAETERFSNDRTTPQTMSVSAELMAAGANQQLVANKLEEPAPAPPPPPVQDEPVPAPQEGEPAAPAAKKDDGTLEITHEKPADQPAPDNGAVEGQAEQQEQSQPVEEAPQIHIDERGELKSDKPSDEGVSLPEAQPQARHSDRPYLGAPSHRTDDDGHTLLGNSPSNAPMSASSVMPDGFTGGDALSLPDLDMPLLDRQPLQPREPISEPSVAPAIMPPKEPEPQGSAEMPPADDDNKTLSQIEADVNSTHLNNLTPYEPLDSDPNRPSPAAGGGEGTPSAPPAQPVNEQLPDAPTVEDARSAVEKAIGSMGGERVAPIEALGAHELGSPHGGAVQVPAPSVNDPIKGASGLTIVQPDGSVVDDSTDSSNNPPAQPTGVNPPPPGPPPMLPPLPPQ